MSTELLNLDVTDHARIPYSALGQEERRIVDAWFDHLRNWKNDDFIRSKSKRLVSMENVYTFQTSTDLVIAFKIDADRVQIMSIFRKEALRPFETAAQGAA